MTDITNPIFQDADKARKHLETVQWPDGPVCPHCKSTNAHKLNGKSHRPGLYQCNNKECREQFTVTVGTVFERSKVPLHKWLLATHLLTASKKGMSAHQLHRMLGVTYKTAWFMAHRIREAMQDDEQEPLGGKGKPVEADETFIGRKYETRKRPGGPYHKHAVLTMIERGGRAKSVHLDKLTTKNVRQHVVQNIDRKSDLKTDRAYYYVKVGKEFASHERVDHGRFEYVRGEAHTNTCEGFFSIFKRGMKGIYQHCGEQHLHRYLREFDFRYNFRKIEDHQRRDEALKGISGKRLTYRRTSEAGCA